MFMLFKFMLRHIRLKTVNKNVLSNRLFVTERERQTGRRTDRERQRERQRENRKREREG